MRAILIDPVAQTVTETQVEPGLSALYAAVGCTTIDIISLGQDRAGQGIDMVIDDEGRFVADQRCFKIGEMLIAGRGLIVGNDGAGETIGSGLSLSDVTAKVRWMTEDTDYTPEPPTIIGFKDFDMLKFLIPRH